MFADRIDKRLAKAIGSSELKTFQVNRKELPSYRFVDVFRATERFLESQAHASQIVSEHVNEALHRIIHEEALAWATRAIKRSPNVSWPVAPGEEVYLPTDTFWLCAVTPDATKPQAVLRLAYNTFTEHTVLEVGCTDADWLTRAMHAILEDSVEKSIYRDATLEVAFESGARDEYGDVESQERLRVLFKELRPVGDDDLIVDESILKTLTRNVIDIHRRRPTLKRHGVPIRRGVLLYGPPGTGKTFACRYVCGKLTGITKIMVTGSALFQVNAIFRLARMLQPSLLILEDVDLVFATREVNLYSSVLGDMLDQMDGLRPFEDISFLLTTNAIDRMEAAIKDRPGRISQLIHFGAPNQQLRSRYLARYLQPYEPLGFSSDDLAALSDGTTQAFLKEWVHRSVQVATERLAAEDGDLQLRLADFEEAMREMKEHAKGSSSEIIGFHQG